MLEHGFISVARDLVDSIASDSSVSQIHLVASCLEGLQKANAQINACKSIYNMSAIAYQGIRRSSVLKDFGTNERFVIVDLGDWMIDLPIPS